MRPLEASICFLLVHIPWPVSPSVKIDHWLPLQFSSHRSGEPVHTHALDGTVVFTMAVLSRTSLFFLDGKTTIRTTVGSFSFEARF